MIKFYDENGAACCLKGYDDFSITHKIDGNDELSFILPTNSEVYKHIAEETKLEYGDNLWIVKKIDSDKFDCKLDFDFLKERAYLSLKEETKPLSYILRKYLPTGWTVYGSNIANGSRTIEFDCCTDYDIIQQCMKTYEVYFVWEIKNKKLYVYSQSLDAEGIGGTTSDFSIRLYAYGYNGLTMQNATVNGSTYGKEYIASSGNQSNFITIVWRDESITTANALYSSANSKISTLLNQLNTQQGSGEYITKELNLKSLSFKGDSSDFATRLYAYGKENLTMEAATVNGSNYGLTYVENKSYCDKTVCVTWKDERYTTAQGLYEAALEKLSEYAYPTRSYECSVNDLAKQNSSFDFLKFKMHYRAILLDPDRKTRVVHKVVEYVEYPEEPYQNVVTLSCTAGTIQSYISSVSSATKEEAAKEADDSMKTKILMATAMLLGAFGTYKFEDDEGNTYLADNEILSSAESVWIINKNGIGHSSTGVNGPYTTALTANDELLTGIVTAMEIRGSYIKAGSIDATKISQSYTDGVVSSAVSAAENGIDAIFEDKAAGLSSRITANTTAIENKLNGEQVVKEVYGTNLLNDSKCFEHYTNLGNLYMCTASVDEEGENEEDTTYYPKVVSDSDVPSENKLIARYQCYRTWNQAGLSFSDSISKILLPQKSAIKADTFYCLSFYAKHSSLDESSGTESDTTSNDLSISLSYLLGLGSGKTITYDYAKSSTTTYNSTLGCYEFKVTNSWQRFHFVFKVDSTPSDFILRFWHKGTSGTSYNIHLSSLQLEAGNAVSDWEENIYEITNSDKYLLTEKYESDFKQTKESISATVKSIEELKSEESSDIQSLEEKISNVKLTAESLDVSFKTLKESGTSKVETESGYKFDDSGIHISRSDSDISTTVDHDGMEVKDDDETVLKADSNGVDAKNLSATTYLIVGANSRFEDYSNGAYTACFWLGG